MQFYLEMLTIFRQKFHYLFIYFAVGLNEPISDVQLEYKVLVRDGGSPPLSAIGRLTLSVVDVDDCPPRFSQSVYIFDVVETCQSGTAVGKVTASDADSWPFNIVRLVSTFFAIKNVQPYNIVSD